MSKLDEVLNRLRARNYKISPLTLTEKETDYVTFGSVSVGTEGTALTIQPPAGQIFIIPGVDDVEKVEEAGMIWVHFADSSDNEIDDESGVRLIAEESYGATEPVDAGRYGQFNQMQRDAIRRARKTIYIAGPASLKFKVTPKTYAIASSTGACSIQGILATPQL